MNLQKPNEIHHEDLLKDLSNSPSEIPINLIVNGTLAKKLHFVITLLSKYYNLPEDEIIKFILRQGVEKEIEKIGNVFSD
jgi:hypothetical protein